ncbi:MAG: hypothetical protein HQK76_10250 [Desulfobacterales bacterium]|nr:hypothetical protein [Desulfobacterales bacterium]
MKQYVIDEIRLNDYKKLKEYFNKNYKQTSPIGIYWIPLEESILTEEQKKHTNCQPLYFALDITENQISSEFLIRSPNTLKCNCIAYASEYQRNWLINHIDSILNELEISA